LAQGVLRECAGPLQRVAAMQSYSQIRPVNIGLSIVGSGLAFHSVPQQRLGGHQLGKETRAAGAQGQQQQDRLQDVAAVGSGLGGVLALTVSAVVLHHARRTGTRSRQVGPLTSRTSRTVSASQGAAVSSAHCPAESTCVTAKERLGECPAVAAAAALGASKQGVCTHPDRDGPNLCSGHMRAVEATAAFISSVKATCIHPDREFPMLCGDCPRDFEGAGAVQQNQNMDLTEKGIADCSKCRTKNASASFISSMKAECVHPDREFPMLCGDCPRN